MISPGRRRYWVLYGYTGSLKHVIADYHGGANGPRGERVDESKRGHCSGCNYLYLAGKVVFLGAESASRIGS